MRKKILKETNIQTGFLHTDKTPVSFTTPCVWLTIKEMTMLQSNLRQKIRCKKIGNRIGFRPKTLMRILSPSEIVEIKYFEQMRNKRMTWIWVVIKMTKCGQYCPQASAIAPSILLQPLFLPPVCVLHNVLKKSCLLFVIFSCCFWRFVCLFLNT